MRRAKIKRKSGTPRKPAVRDGYGSVLIFNCINQPSLTNFKGYYCHVIVLNATDYRRIIQRSFQDFNYFELVGTIGIDGDCFTDKNQVIKKKFLFLGFF